MPGDFVDRLHWFVLTAAVAALVGLLAFAAPRQGEATPTAGSDKALERQIAYQARTALLQQLYGPVEALVQAGRPQQALLELEALGRSYPGEAHGQILKGEILRGMGALEQAAASYVAGVRLNGDYVDRQSPLTRRAEIRQLVDAGLATVGPRAAANPENASLAAALKDLRYLQSRLAGGCE
jgi:hypothetical protein